jgi:hypothetical protein
MLLSGNTFDGSVAGDYFPDRGKAGHEMMDEGVILAYALMLMLFFGAFFIRGLLTRRAALKVIKTFCRYDALSSRSAKKADELGLNPPGLIERISRLRDYKPEALRGLKEMKVVRTTSDGRLYMTEKQLNENLRCNRQ